MRGECEWGLRWDGEADVGVVLFRRYIIRLMILEGILVGLVLFF